MEWLAVVAQYTFDDSDWAAVDLLLGNTDADDDRWCSYPLVGAVSVDVYLARHVDADPVMMRAEGDVSDLVLARMDTVIAILADSNVHDIRTM